MVDLESDVADSHEPVSTRRLLLAYMNEQRIRLDTSSPQSRFISRALLIAFVLATVMVLVSHFDFGPDDPYLPGGIGGGSISAVISLTVLLLAGVFLAAATWHARARLMKLIPPGVALINAVVGLSLISTAATIRNRAGVFERIPSLVPASSADGDLPLVLGVLVLVSCVVMLTVNLLASEQRIVVASLAALPAVLSAVAFLFADRGTLRLSTGANQLLLDQTSASTFLYITAPSSARIINAPMLILFLGSTAFIFLLAAFGVAEFVDAKSKVARLFVGVRAVKSWVVGALVGVVALVLIAGRLGWLPEGEEAAGAFKENALEAWIVAALMAMGGLVAIRSAHRRPLERHRVRPVIAIACVSLVAGQLALFVAALLVELAFPIVNPTSAVGHFIFERLPGWASWFETWTALTISIGLGLWAIWRLTRSERSDRVAFALAYSVVVFPLQLTKVLEQHNANEGFWGYHNATPDLIALAAIGIIVITTIARRPLFDNRTTAIVIVVAFLVALLDAAVPADWTIGTFQLLLVAPFVYRFLFNSGGRRPSADRAAVTMAGIGLLFVASSVAVAIGGLTSKVFEVAELFAFIQLCAPLALLVLCPTVPASGEAEMEEQSTGGAWQKWSVLVAGLATLVLLVGATAFATVRLPAKSDRAPYQVDVHVTPDGLIPRQVRADPGAEAVDLTNEATYIFIIHTNSTDRIELFPCTEGSLRDGYGFTPSEPLREVDPIAGLPAVSVAGTLRNGAQATVTCGNVTVGNVARTIAVFEEGSELSETARSVAESVVFREE